MSCKNYSATYICYASSKRKNDSKGSNLDTEAREVGPEEGAKETSLVSEGR